MAEKIFARERRTPLMRSSAGIDEAQPVSVYGELCHLVRSGDQYVVRDSRGIRIGKGHARFAAIADASSVLRRRAALEGATC